MSKLWYFLATFAESGLSVFGVRGGYEQPAYQVVRTLSSTIEIRHYPARVTVETPMASTNDGAAFQRLFRYITGANAGDHTISMTVPVEQSSTPQTMRFFLPAAAGAPAPTDPAIHIATLPEATLGVIRYSGLPTSAVRAAQTETLRTALTRAGETPAGDPSFLSYDPPFTVPFLRRNEVAIPLAPRSSG